LALGKSRLQKLPMGGGWTDHRDFPVPQGGTFQAQWNAKLKALK
jgi:L-lactate dehydrogenase complex protein LldF